jgi:hypothetical protein
LTPDFGSLFPFPPFHPNPVVAAIKLHILSDGLTSNAVKAKKNTALGPSKNTVPLK